MVPKHTVCELTTNCRQLEKAEAKLTNVRAYETPKALKDYGVTHVPQSFIYLKQQND